MLRKLFSIIAASLVALSVASNWQAFIELRDMSVLAHLAAYSNAGHEHDDEDHHNSVDTHTHKHRHAPDQPEHEHTHSHLGCVTTVTAANVPPIDSISRLILPPALGVRFALEERVPPSFALSSLLRPPIA